MPANAARGGDASPVWFRFCFGRGMSRIVGRSLAMCLHPYATWRSRSNRGRAFVLLAYLAGSYAAVLGALFLWH